MITKCIYCGYRDPHQNNQFIWKNIDHVIVDNEFIVDKGTCKYHRQLLKDKLIKFRTEAL